jgi:hypothetical protein
MAIDWVSLDVGETLVDETRQWFSSADWLGVSRLIIAAARGITCQKSVRCARVATVCSRLSLRRVNSVCALKRISKSLSWAN